MANEKKSGINLPPSAPPKSVPEPEYYTPVIDDSNEVTAPGLSVVVTEDAQAAAPASDAPAAPVLTNAMVVTPEMLQSIINTAVTAAIKATQSSNDIDRIVAAITNGMAAAAPRKQVTIGEYMARPENRKLKLTRQCFQNGFPIYQDGNILNEEIALLNQITHSGRYINRIVEVVVRQQGLEQEVYISYPNKSIDQRMTAQRHWRSFTDLLSQIVEAQKVERAEQEEVDKMKAELRARAQSRVQEENANAAAKTA